MFLSVVNLFTCSPCQECTQHTVSYPQSTLHTGESWRQEDACSGGRAGEDGWEGVLGGGGVKLEYLWNTKRPKSTLLADNTRGLIKIKQPNNPGSSMSAPTSSDSSSVTGSGRSSASISLVVKTKKTCQIKQLFLPNKAVPTLNRPRTGMSVKSYFAAMVSTCYKGQK